jgi:hypothetical protein
MSSMSWSFRSSGVDGDSGETGLPGWAAGPATRHITDDDPYFVRRYATIETRSTPDLAGLPGW